MRHEPGTRQSAFKLVGGCADLGKNRTIPRLASPWCVMSVANVSVNVLIDSGATVNLLDHNFVYLIPGAAVESGREHQLAAVNGSLVDHSGIITLTFSLGLQTFTAKFF